MAFIAYNSKDPSKSLIYTVPGIPYGGSTPGIIINAKVVTPIAVQQAQNSCKKTAVSIVKDVAVVRGTRPTDKNICTDPHCIETPPVIPPKEIPLKKEILLEKRQLTLNEDVFAIGKRKIVIDNGNFGPTLSDRKTGINLTPDGSEIKDYLRFVTGRYWTTSDDGKSLIFLDKVVQGTPWNVRDFNYSNDSTKLIDREISASKGNVSLGSIGSINNYAFATTQWMLIQANSPFNVISPALSALVNKQSSAPNSALSAKTLSPTIYQSNVNTNNLTFNQNLYNKSLGVTTANKTSPTNNVVVMNINLDLSRRGTIAPSLQALIDRTPKTPTPAFTGVRLPAPRVVLPTPVKPEPLFEPGIKTNIDFFDHSFELPTPFTSKELKKYNSFIKPLTSNIESTYNFMINKYEEVTNKINTDERVLPNMYVLMSEIMKGTNNPDFINHLTLNNTITMKDTPAPRTSKLMDLQNKQIKKFAGEYFDIFSRKLEEIFNNTKDQSMVDKKNEILTTANKFVNMIVPENNLDLIKDFNDKKYLFPMFVDIQFSTDTTTIMTDLFKKSKFTSLIEKRIAYDTVFNDGVQQENYLEASELIQQSQTEFKKDLSFEKTRRRFWDITELLSDENQALSAFNVLLGDYSTEQFLSSNVQANNFIKNLYMIIFVGKLRKIMEQKFRTFEELMSGKLAYSETVLYRIEKSEINADGTIGNLLQNYIIPNFNELELINLVDTQVKYNKKYSYRVYAYQAVIGTKYNYSNLTSLNKLAMVKITQYPSVRLIEIPYIELKTQVIDNPPVFPEVEFIPYKGVNNKALFFLRSNTGEYITDPVLIEPTDKAAFDEIRKGKDLDPEDPITFRTDDHTGIFQIFRIEKKPTKYQDFAGSLMIAVQTDVSKITPQVATSAAYVDTIEPNKKYYYMFRIVDDHGHISNPSPIYQIEMIDQEGMVYPLLEVVDVTEKPQKKTQRSFRKYIKISPALAQELLNEQKTGVKDATTAKNIANVSLGVRDETVWDRQFKIRLISKSTGRKIDFNIDFNIKNVKRIETNDQK